ncbi:MAG: hypothetical protein ACR2NP_19350, partial [Pirellulaceae bacterium]
MNNPQINELRKTLTAQGYSRTYINRLCGELHDHLCCVVEQHDPPSDLSQERQLGSSQEIARVVAATPELGRLAWRFPLSIFILLPGLFLCLWSWLSILFAYQVRTHENRFAGFESTTIDIFHPGTMWLPAIVVAAIAVIAIRSRVHWLMPLMSAALLSLNGFFQIHLASCVGDDSVFFSTIWGFHTGRFLAPWIGLATVLGVAAIYTV